MLLLCVVNDCPANFSLAVQRHTNGRHTCGAHKLRIRRIGQPACLPVSIYLLFFLSARSQRDAKRRDSTSLDSTLGHILCRPFIIFHGVDTFTCFSKQTQATTTTLTSLFFMATPSSLFFSPSLSLYHTDPSALLSFLVLVTRCQIY